MFESILLTTAIVGTFLASLWDLKTTEVPDPIPYTMIGIGVAVALIQSFIHGTYSPILNSLIAGGLLLAFGALMYFSGQWGGADVLLLAGVGFLLPEVKDVKLLFPFPFSYLLNVFLIGATYMIIYAIILALLNKKIIFSFLKEMKGSARIFLIGSLILFILFFWINYYILLLLKLPIQYFLIVRNSLLPLVVAIGVYIILKFAKIVEEVGFKKKIKTSKLKVGDVLAKEKFWRGITEKELKKIKASGKKFVVIKSGVRFAPVFLLALISTLYFGDGVSLLLKIFVSL